MCEEFSYGGCLGNDNRFETLDVCETRCVSPHKPGGCGYDYRKCIYLKLNVYDDYEQDVLIWNFQIANV